MDETLTGWLDALASDRTTPGGGAASALLIATGAALVAMACGLTAGRERFREVDDEMRRALRVAADLRAEAQALGPADSGAYDAVSAAYALPRATAEEKATRTEAIQQALRGATEVPLRTAEVGVAVLELAASIAAKANPNVISDVGAGALAARAGAEAAALNVKINLVTIKDREYVTGRRVAVESLLARAESAAGTVLAAVHAAIER